MVERTGIVDQDVELIFAPTKELLRTGANASQ